LIFKRIFVKIAKVTKDSGDPTGLIMPPRRIFFLVIIGDESLTFSGYQLIPKGDFYLWQLAKIRNNNWLPT
jgi:hypothetical protein